MLLKSGLRMAAIVGSVVGVASARTIVVDGGFENPKVQSASGWDAYFNGDVMGAWSIGGAGVVLVGDFGSPAAYEGEQCVELNYFEGGSVQQDLTTTPGQWYNLSFAMSGQINQGPETKTLHIYWGTEYLGQFAWSQTASGGAWELHDLDVQATSDNSTLLIVGEVDVDGGPYLDDVRVVAVPAPSALAILAVAGAAGITGRIRRRARP